MGTFYEDLAYDASGQFLAGSLMDYQMPRAGDFPSIGFSMRNVPCKANPLGVKGAGEAGGPELLAACLGDLVLADLDLGVLGEVATALLADQEEVTGDHRRRLGELRGQRWVRGVHQSHRISSAFGTRFEERLTQEALHFMELTKSFQVELLERLDLGRSRRRGVLVVQQAGCRYVLHGGGKKSKLCATAGRRGRARSGLRATAVALPGERKN